MLSGMNPANGLRPRRARLKALFRTTTRTTIGARKRTPPRTVVPIKREMDFIAVSSSMCGLFACDISEPESQSRT